MMPESQQIKQNILDRVIAYITPNRAARRMYARSVMAFAGSYIGASRSRRALKEWRTSRGDANADIITDLPALRERSRDLSRNDPVAVGAISTCVTNVVGTGLKLQSRIDRDVLKMTDEEAEAWENKAEREYRLWSESLECHRSRQWNMPIIQELAFRQTLENGEIFITLPRITRKGSPYRIKLDMIEADRVCNADRARNTETLIEGIEKDGDGAPVRYHMLNQHPGSQNRDKAKDTWEKIDAYGIKTGLPNVLHLFRPLRPGQNRGVPYLAPVIEALKQLGRYTETELMAAVIASMFTVFIKNEKSAFGTPPFNSENLGQETGAATSDKDIKLAPGSIVELSGGREVQVADPKRPNAAFDPFVTAILQQIGAALEIPYEIIIRHFSSSYSASRAALLEAWRFFRGRRSWLVNVFCQPLYEVFIYEAVAMGRLPAPGFFADPMIRKAYCGAEWIGDAPGYIDPAKDIDAAEKRMELAISTLDQETALITGGDMEKNIPRIRKERKLLEEIGLWQPGQKKQTAPQIPALDNPDESGDPNNPDDKKKNGGQQ